MDRNLGYLNNEYAREKMIESYDIEAKEREAKEVSDFALKTVLEINERYIKINRLEEGNNGKSSSSI